MSLADEFDYVGPQPEGQKVNGFTGILRREDGSLRGVFIHEDHKNQPVHLPEYSIFEEMVFYSEMSENDDLKPKERVHAKLQSEILHFALAFVQKNKLDNNEVLKAPLTMHPDVDTKLEGLKSVDLNNSAPEV